jgi:hypothetical protein
MDPSGRIYRYGRTTAQLPPSKGREGVKLTQAPDKFHLFSWFNASVSLWPDPIVDLLGYQSSIVEVSREYERDTWFGYDMHFRRMAAATPGPKWATVDLTLWNMAFTGHARVQRCKYCFSLSYQVTECESGPNSKSSCTSSCRFMCPSLKVVSRRYSQARQDICNGKRLWVLICL